MGLVAGCRPPLGQVRGQGRTHPAAAARAGWVTVTVTVMGAARLPKAVRVPVATGVTGGTGEVMATMRNRRLNSRMAEVCY